MSDMLSSLRAVQQRVSNIEQRFTSSRWVFANDLEDAINGTTPEVAGEDALTVADPLAADVATADRLALLSTFETDGSTLTADDGAWIRQLPESGQEWAGAIADAARANDVEPELLAALVWQESGFDAASRSAAGATGLAQLMPETASILGVNAAEPLDNLAGGARFLAEMLDRYDGNVELALAAYNAGPSRVDAAGGIPDIAETSAYVPQVLERLAQLTDRQDLGAAQRAASLYLATGALR